MLRHAANIECYIEVELVVYLYFDIRLGERAESGRGDCKLIVPGWQRQNAKRTVGGRDGFLLEIVLHICSYDMRARHDALRAVAHHSQDRAGYIRTQNIRTENHC